MLTAIVVYMCVGAIAGLLAGLLGVGGGLVIVPMITYAMALQGISTPYSHHIALGTSLASIMFTSVSSFMAHHRNKAVQWHIVRQVTMGILVGTFVGSKVATLMPIVWLKGFFIVFLYYVATQMVLNIKPSGSRTIPGIVGNSLAGSVIGFVSSLVGIGGGTLSVPYMTWCNVPMRTAIGTSAAIGFPIAIAGAAGYVFNGLGKEALPAYTLGFIYLPALAGITVASVCTAPFGAKLAHTLPIPKLKRYFALLLYVVATQMLYTLVR
ncbi:sulfite exporter TauE/SafE family protein [Desulfovibrio cuneatus]|uniref:sulfite exporter TauE/SafE family protein n=1 Tax=Desulfovibrio cuneatus TaxID=159728 RepID=UPI000400F2B2|nr:sulfite exporter TauE/SafE family protein [Desulfovibrio cuneatus]